MVMKLFSEACYYVCTIQNVLNEFEYCEYQEKEGTAKNQSQVGERKIAKKNKSLNRKAKKNSTFLEMVHLSRNLILLCKNLQSLSLAKIRYVVRRC